MDANSDEKRRDGISGIEIAVLIRKTVKRYKGRTYTTYLLVVEAVSTVRSLGVEE